MRQKLRSDDPINGGLIWQFEQTAERTIEQLDEQRTFEQTSEQIALESVNLINAEKWLTP